MTDPRRQLPWPGAQVVRTGPCRKRFRSAPRARATAAGRASGCTGNSSPRPAGCCPSSARRTDRPPRRRPRRPLRLMMTASASTAACPAPTGDILPPNRGRNACTLPAAPRKRTPSTPKLTAPRSAQSARPSVGLPQRAQGSGARAQISTPARCYWPCWERFGHSQGMSSELGPRPARGPERSHSTETVTFHGVITEGQTRPGSGRQCRVAVMVTVPASSAWKVAIAPPSGVVPPLASRATSGVLD